jgi:hypothetical protein
MPTIYILKLKKNKYYISHSKDPNTIWTKRYPLIKILKQFPEMSEHDLGNATLSYMFTRGIDNVRSDSWPDEHLSTTTVELIEYLHRQSAPKCIQCNNYGHYTGICPKQPTPTKQSNVCERCHRYTHTRDGCFETTYEDGEPIFDDDPYGYSGEPEPIDY